MSKYTFSTTPKIYNRRTQFDLSFDTMGSLSIGRLVPIYCQEVVPGDFFKIEDTPVLRISSNFVKPIFANMSAQVYYFFVPNRLCYDKSEQVFGEAKPSAYHNPDSVEYPVVGLASGHSNHNIVVNSLADYFGLELSANAEQGSAEVGYRHDINILPFRGFAKIYNTWFRDQNSIDEIFVNTGETADNEYFNANEFAPDNYMGMPPKVSKYHDYFTSALPNTQKGLEASVSVSGFVPLSTTENVTSFGSVSPLLDIGFVDNTSLSYPLYVQPNTPTGTTADLGVDKFEGQTKSITDKIKGSNLGVQLDSSSINVNDLRYAFQLQKMLEREARSGSRYNEILLSQWGVVSPDSRLQLPEFLGGGRVPIQIQQVIQTAPNTTGDNAVGDLSAYSLSVGKLNVSKAFVEHGFIIGVMCIRQEHIYSQGIERFWSRKRKLDYYNPVFANIGEQPIYTKELYAKAEPTRVFGYGEAWADYRYRPNKVVGQLRPGELMAIWSSADNYQNQPVLSKDFLEETPRYIDRSLAIESTAQDQFIYHIHHKVKAIREMPLYSVPSLIDHN